MSSRFPFPQGNKSGSEGAVVACENIRFSSLFAAGDVSWGGTSATPRETSPAAKSEEKWMFSQARAVEIESRNLKKHSILDFGILHCTWKFERRLYLIYFSLQRPLELSKKQQGSLIVQMMSTRWMWLFYQSYWLLLCYVEWFMSSVEEEWTEVTYQQLMFVLLTVKTFIGMMYLS